jgi:hypothetical protein
MNEIIWMKLQIQSALELDHQCQLFKKMWSFSAS